MGVNSSRSSLTVPISPQAVWLRFRLLVVAGWLIGGGWGVSAAPAQSPPQVEPSQVEPRQVEEEKPEASEAERLPEVSRAIIKRTNRFRQRNNQEPLARDEQLMATAEAFAKFMAINDKYGHRADGRTPAERAKAHGYAYCVIRENIAYRRDPTLADPSKLIETFVQGWIDSDEHRHNMLADYITETGVAVATADQTTFFAVQMFGRPESLRFKVQLTNRTEETQELTLEHDGNSDSYELPPRVRLTVTRCLPTNFVLNGEQTLRLKESAELAITTNSESKAELVRKASDE